MRSQSIELGIALLLAFVGIAVPIAATPVAADTVSTRFQLQVPVLYYHHVACPSPTATEPDLWICPDLFEAQMTYLHDQGWTTITADQLADLMASRTCPGPKEFVASFDDGPVDSYTNAAPILESLGMRGTFFVTTGVPDGTLSPAHMTWDQVRDLVLRGHSIGNHTETHLSLNKQTPDIVYEQIEGAQQILQKQLGYRPRTFAYPYGRYNDSVMEQVASSGFDLAFTVHLGAKEASDDPYEAKRIGVASTDSGSDVLARIASYSEGCKPASPDLSVALSSAGPFKGTGVFATEPVRTQTVKRTGVKVGTTYRYWMTVENASQSVGRFALTATLSGTATMDVRYKVNGVDVTAAVRAGTYLTPILEPWTSMTVVIRVTPLSPSTVGQSTSVVLRAASSTDPSRVDVARVTASL